MVAMAMAVLVMDMDMAMAMDMDMAMEDAMAALVSMVALADIFKTTAGLTKKHKITTIIRLNIAPKPELIALTRHYQPKYYLT